MASQIRGGPAHVACRFVYEPAAHNGSYQAGVLLDQLVSQKNLVGGVGCLFVGFRSVFKCECCIKQVGRVRCDGKPDP